MMMSQPDTVAPSSDNVLTPVLLCLRTDVQIKHPHRANFVPKSKKARGLLALVAMTDTHAVSRHLAAVSLWSNVDRTIGLARLRDVLHNLRKELLDEQANFLDLRGDIILFKPGTFVIDFPGSGSVQEAWDEFLIDLDGIDKAFDRWLAHARAVGRRSKISVESTDPFVQVVSTSSRRQSHPSLVLTELDISGSEPNTQFSRGLTDELGLSLARLRWFTTVTRDIHGQRLSIGNESLSNIADYALVGTLQCDGAHCRLQLKLIGLQNSGAIEWATSLDEPSSFNLAVQEAFANAVAARLDSELLFVETNRQLQRQAGWKDNAYTLVLQAVHAINRLEHDSFIDAGHLLERAMYMDRGSGLAYSWMAYWHVFFVGQGWATNTIESMTKAASAANHAMMLDPRDARAVTISGHVKAFLNRQLGEATTLHELALQLNPALGLAWHFSAMTHAYAGRLDDALRCILRCRELVPHEPHAFYSEGGLGIVRLLRHDHENAISVGRRVTERHPNFTSGFKSYLAALGHTGQKVEAEKALQRLLILEPDFSLRRFRLAAPYQRKEDLNHFTEGLRLSGVI